MRTNGAFAAAPIVIYWLRPGLLVRPVRFMTACAAFVAVAVVLSGPINHRLLAARNSGAQNSLLVFDVVGIAAASGSLDVFDGDPAVTTAIIDRCYTPKLWDPIGKGVCRAAIINHGVRARTWLASIVRRPVAYLSHRVAHFNELMFAITPVSGWAHSNLQRHPELARPRLLPELLRWHGRWADDWAFAPILYWILAGCVAGLTWRSTSVTSRAAFVLAISSVLYGGGYLIVGVANMPRYQFYTCMAAMCALLLYGFGRWRERRAPRLGEWAAVAAVTAAAVAVWSARTFLSPAGHDGVKSVEVNRPHA